MKQTICHWKYCRTPIEVDNHIEKNQSFFTVVGFCDIHHQALRIYTELEKRFCKKKNIDWPVGSLSYKKYQKELHEIHVKSGRIAKKSKK